MPMPFDDLINVIETLKERMTTHRQSLQQHETRTRVALIDPLLTALGWDVSDPGLVTPEYSVGQGRPDYALINGGPESKPVAIVEAKPLGNFLNDRERNQMLAYANMEGIKYAILTNGDLWELYDIFEPARLDERRLLNVKITSTPAYQLALQMLLLWRPNLASGAPVAAQEPVLGTRQEMATAEAVPQPVDTPLARMSSLASPTSSPPVERTWVKLSTYQPPELRKPSGGGRAKNTPAPKKIKFPNGTEEELGKWSKFIETTAEWLTNCGYSVTESQRDKHGNAHTLYKRTKILLEDFNVSLDSVFLLF